jgi:hypothetical protein
MAFIMLQASYLHGVVFSASVHSDALLSIERYAPPAIGYRRVPTVVRLTPPTIFATKVP